MQPVLSTLGAGPLLYVTLGVGGAGLASTFEPLRPWLLGATALLLGFGFYGVYGPGPRCADEDFERKRRRQKAALWVGTLVVLVLATFPIWSTWIL